MPTLEDVDNGATADDDDDVLVFFPADDDLGFLDRDEGILDDDAPFGSGQIALPVPPFNSDEQFGLGLSHLLSRRGTNVTA